MVLITFQFFLLKLSAPTTIESLTYIINLAIRSCTMLNDWKCARVTPVHKEGCKMNPNNYRPISVLSVIPKIFEKVIFDQMYEYLTTHNLSNLQSGFRPLHSTLTALLDATDQWYTNMDNGLINGTLTFRKLLIQLITIFYKKKLSYYGFSNNTLDLFRNYLSERTQVTVINNISSQKCSLQCGVPQGSILEPLLFLIYIHDLPDCNLMSDCRLFADDTNLTYVDKDYNQVFSAMKSNLNIPKSWLDANKLSLNALKTKCMLIFIRQPQVSNHT